MKTIVKTTQISKEKFLVATINSIKKQYASLRQDSKPVTFALQYAGTPHTLVANSGFNTEEAANIYERYHKLYAVSAEYAETKKKEATQNGFVTLAFGLRLRTPLLSQVVYGSAKMPYEADSEGRTAGNALSQSYGLLNNRAAVDFMQKVWASPYRLDIKPIALIHDAIYLLIRDDVRVVDWANRELIKSMQWQELPEIQHPTVKLGAALDIFWPSWANSITLPNNATQEEIREVADKGKADYAESKITHS